MTAKQVAWLGCLLLASGVVLAEVLRQWQNDSQLEARLRSLRLTTDEREIPCSSMLPDRPLVLLALGQSNAGNHGVAHPSPLAPVILIADGRCVLAADPLPGATGLGASIWRRLPDALLRHGVMRPVLLSVLAVDATSIDDWTRTRSPLRRLLEAKVLELNALGLAPSFVLWQQGEADSLTGTSGRRYADGLTTLADALFVAGTTAPILLARSTVCRSPASEAIRSAIESAPARNSRFRLGPDTDSLAEPRHRIDGCHFSAEGLSVAADLWAERIKAQPATVAH